VDVGPTDEVWAKNRTPYLPERYGQRWAPVLVVWSTEQQVPGLTGYIAGFAGPTAVPAPDGTLAFVSGQVVLDTADLTASDAGPASPDSDRFGADHGPTPCHTPPVHSSTAHPEGSRNPAR
jgi:hypothetical protein